MLIFVIFERSRRFFSPSKFDPFFRILFKSLLNMPKNSILKIKKINSLEKFLSPKNCKNGQKRLFFGPGGPNFDPFSTIFCISLLNMSKNIILKNQKNSFTRKKSKSKKLQKWPKKVIFWPWRAKFWPFFHNFVQITSKYAQKHHIKNLEKFIH